MNYPAKIIPAACCLFCMSILAGCGAEAVPEQRVRPVRAIELQQPAAGEVREFPAVVQAARETPVAFRVGGPVLEMAVAQGDRVEAGDTIALLDPRDYEVARDAAAARFVELRARLARVRGMYENGNASRSDLDRVQAARDMAAAELEAAENALRDTRLTAPFSGVIGLELAETGQIVAAGVPVATLLAAGDWEVRAGVPEELTVLADTFADFRVTLDSYPGREFAARLKELGDRPGEGLRAYPLVVAPQFPADMEAAAGMGARLRFFCGRDSEAGFLLPASAVFNRGGEGSLVWIFDPETGLVSSREVRLDGVAGRGVRVSDGLRAGEWVVTAGAHRLDEGMKVRLLDEPAATNVGGER